MSPMRSQLFVFAYSELLLSNLVIRKLCPLGHPSRRCSQHWCLAWRKNKLLLPLGTLGLSTLYSMVACGHFTQGLAQCICSVNVFKLNLLQSLLCLE